MKRIDTAAEREPGLASEALRALSDLARDEEPQPAPEAPVPTLPQLDTDRDTGPDACEMSDAAAVPPVVAPASRQRDSQSSRGVLLAVVVVSLLLCVGLLLTFVLN